MSQPESIVDDLTFALFPEIAHNRPPTANSCKPANEDTPNSVACTAERAPWRLRQGWKVSTCDSQAPGRGARRPHSGMKRGGMGSEVPIGYVEATRGPAKGALNGWHGQAFPSRDAGASEDAGDF